MFTFRNITSASLLVIALSSYVSGQNAGTNQETARDLEAFQKLLDQVDTPSLHEALHSFSPKKYKHGAFPEDRTAVEVIHKEEPSIATSIVNLARRQNSEVVDLSKRQVADNGTATTNTPATPNPQTTAHFPTPVPPISEGSTIELASTTEPSSTPPTSASATSNGTPVPSATSATSAGAVSSSAPSIASSTPSTTAKSISLTAGGLITTTNGVGLTIISTVGGGATTISPSGKGVTSTNTHQAGPHTSFVVQTSSLPDGSKSIITAVTVVGAGEGAADTPTGTAGVGSTSASASPGLQTGEAVMTKGWGKEMVLVVGGAVAFAGMM